MSNINLKIVGTANLGAAQAQFSQLESQVTALNTQLANMVKLQNGVDAKGYANMVRASQQMSQTFRDAAASSGMFHTEQLRVNSATDDYVKNLNKQKLSLRDMAKQSKVASAAYREQLAMMEGMATLQRRGGNMGSKSLVDIAIPTEVSKTLDTTANRLAFLGSELKSGATQMINWGKNTQWAGRQLSMGFTMPLAAAGAAAGALYYQVDQQLTRVTKVYNTTADQTSTSVQDMIAVQQELDNVRKDSTKTAVNAAKDYGVSMKDTLSVAADLAATGAKGAELQKSTTQVVRNATLGEIDYQTATKATIALQQILGQNTQQTAESWNYMNAIENATSLSMKDFAEAIPIAMGPLKEMGGTVQDLGTLLTGMVSRGVQVGKAANAIKALAQRLYRPSQQIKQEFSDITGQSITDITAKNKGNVMGILKDIYNATKNLDKVSKIKVFAGLFGSYQLTTMTNMVDSIGDIANGIGQANTAMQVGQQTAADWARVSNKELKSVQKSASGQFKRAIEGLKADLVEVGKPFLEVATMVIKLVSKILSAFNDLPGPVKVVVAAFLGIAAVSGPLLMLIGLTANLGGNMLKAAANIIQMATKMEILDKETWAARLASEALNTTFMSQTTAVQKLNAELAILTNSLKAAQAQQQRGAAAAVIPGVGATTTTPSGLIVPNNSRASGTATNTSGLVVPQNAGPSNQAVANTKKISVLQATSAASLVAMVGSMITLSATSNTTAQHWANIALTASIALPLVGSLAKGAGSLATKLAAGAANSGGMLAKIAASSASMGAIGVAAGAVGVATYFIAKHFIDANKRAEELRATLAKSTSEMSEQSSLLDQQLGIQQQMKSNQATPGINVETYKTQLPYLLKVADLAQKMNDDQHFKGQVKLIKQSNSEMVKSTVALHVWQQVMTATGGSAEKAELAVASLFAATGEGANQAAAEAKNLRQEFEKMSKVQVNQQLQTLDLQAATMKSGRGNGGWLNDSFWNRGAMAQTTKQFPWSDEKTVQYAYKDAQKQGKQTADQFWTAYMAADAQDRAKVGANLEKSVSSMWTRAFTSAQSNGDNKKAMQDLGIKTAYEYRVAMEQATKIAGTKGANKMKAADRARQTLQAMGLATDMSTDDMLKAMGFDVKNGEFKGISSASGLFTGAGKEGAAAVDVQKALTAELSKQLGYEGKGLTLRQLLNSANAQSLQVTKESAQETYKALVAQQKEAQIAATRHALWKAGIGSQTKYYKDAIAAAGIVTNQQKLQIQNQVLEAAGLQKTDHLYQSIDAQAQSVSKSTKKVADDVNAIPNKKTISLQITGQNVVDMYKDAMGQEQQAIADEIQSQLDKRQQAAQDALQARQEKESDALSKRQDRENDALQARQDKAQSAQDARFDREEKQLDTHWDNMKAKAESYWDARIQKVNDEIDAEKKADEERQKLFDAEIARIQKLNDMANANIDFNTALSSGNFDEAAKIRNDQEASTIASLYETQSQAMSDASQARQDRLGKQADSLEKQKDAYIDRLDKQADAQKAALKARQDREAAALKREQAQQSAALKAQQDHENAALKRRQASESATMKAIQDKEQATLKRRLDLFLSYTASNRKDLNAHLKATGLAYNVSAKKFGSDMRYYMTKSANQLASDAVWSKVGKNSATAILKSIGFDSLGDFTHFVQTGEMPKKKPKSNKNGKGNKAAHDYGPGSAGHYTYHEGGEVGKAASSRKGVAKTTPGLHHSEAWVKAQKGEFVVNKRAAAANSDLLNSINSGKHVMGGAADGPVSGVTGLMSGLITSMLVAGITRGMASGTNKASAKAAAAAAGMFGMAAAGEYGSVNFTSEQLKNANIIASVGKSMGMSGRDIEIGIMTAITESGLRNLHGGDRDSQGLFQQRPSQGWGTVAQVTDPNYAAKKFFEVLKGVSNRNKMTPWMAAQSVQRSAFSDGSNYRKWWTSASAIYKAMEQAGGSISGFVSGPGGRFKPINRNPTSGLHDQSTGYPAVDFATPVGTPVYAVSDGRITRSEDIRGYEPRRAAYGKGQDGYRSYGRVIYLKTNGGPEVLYAHLSKRSVHTGQAVKGGSIIGRSGDTGNSTGPHLHFGSKGTSPYTWLSGRSGGSPKGGYSLPQLAKGGEIKWDNTVANLHKNETVLTEDLSAKLKDGINNLASGGQTIYNVNVNHNSQTATADDIVNKTIRALDRREQRLGGKK